MINYLLKNFTEITEDSFRLIADTFYKNKQEHNCNEQKFKNHVNYICNNYDFIKNLKHPNTKHLAVWKAIYLMYWHQN